MLTDSSGPSRGIRQSADEPRPLAVFAVLIRTLRAHHTISFSATWTPLSIRVTFCYSFFYHYSHTTVGVVASASTYARQRASMWCAKTVVQNWNAAFYGRGWHMRRSATARRSGFLGIKCDKGDFDRILVNLISS